jgi:hypothetical protein
MTGGLTLYHGAPGDAILQIIADGAMRPDSDHKIYFSELPNDALMHGADRKRKATFAFKATVRIPAGASQARISVPGNPRTVLITTVIPVPVEILELYIRQPRETEISTIRGAAIIKSYLMQPV